MLFPKIKITGTGSYVPERIISNYDLELIAPTSAEWILENLGIKERHVVTSQATSDISVLAAKNAINAAGIDPEEIDCIILATSTPDRIAPSTACIIKNKLKIKNHCPAFDISAVCTGFVYSLSVAATQIAIQDYKKILVIGADCFSKITDWSRRDCVFFGDGAGAAIVEPAEGNALFHSRIFTETENVDHFTVFPNDKYFTMNSRAVYETGSKVLPKAINQVLKEANINISEVKCVIPHQPSKKLLQQAAKKLNVNFSLFKTNMDKYANTSGGTVPIILDETVRAGEIKPNDTIIFAAVGSGWTWGAGVLQWT
jgi:3-oxoacyl-[acyl-carrier-protein] synthase III